MTRLQILMITKQRSVDERRRNADIRKINIEENTNISEGGVLRHTRVIQTRIESGTMMMMVLVMIDGERKRLGIVLVQGEVSVEENDPGLLLIIQTIVEDRKCVLLS